MEFNVDSLETIILDEARRRGDRFFRISVRAREEILFARERLCLDTGRMEKAFNVVLASPGECEVKELPDRVQYYITTGLPFEKAAETVSSFLGGTVDIAELHYASWREEKTHSRNDRPASRAKVMDARRMEIAMIILSYKILHYDMERIKATLSGGEGESGTMTERMESFERRIEGLDAARVMFLAFSSGGEQYLMPRFLVSGFKWGGGERSGSEPESEKQRAAEAEGCDPETGEAMAGSRFGILLSNGPAMAICAERLVDYREIALGEIRIHGRRSRLCFDANVRGESWRLVLPEQAMAAGVRGA